MERRALLSALGVVGLSTLAGCDESRSPDEPTTDSRATPRRDYPDGAGPDHIDFSTLESDDETVLQASQAHWDTFAIVYSEPPGRRRVEGDYYVNSSTGAVISHLWYGAKDYRNGDAYAYVQPAERVPDDRRREEYESDPSFVYDDETNAYYRYDRQYGQVAPTNVGRHTEILKYYGWEATDTSTHHGVPVIAYQLSAGEPGDPRVPPATEGTLLLGIENGIIYAFDLTVDGDEGELRYTYSVRPAPFPDHSWVETARTVAGANSSAERTESE
jgi:hypothetical protein